MASVQGSVSKVSLWRLRCKLHSSANWEWLWNQSVECVTHLERYLFRLHGSRKGPKLGLRSLQGTNVLMILREMENHVLFLFQAKSCYEAQSSLELSPS